MALSKEVLKKALQAMVDKPYGDEETAIVAHAEALSSYLKDAEGPTSSGKAKLFTSEGLEAGVTDFKAAAVRQSLDWGPIADAYVAFAAAAAKQCSSVFTAVAPPKEAENPPPKALDFSTKPANLDAFVNTVHIWAITGTTSAPGSPSPILGVWG